MPILVTLTGNGTHGYRPEMGGQRWARTMWVAAVGVLVLLTACTGGGNEDATPSSSRPPTEADAQQPNRIELRPVLALLPPGGAVVEAGDLVLPALGEAPLRYALGPVALTGRDAVRAKVEEHGTPGWVVVLQLTDEGTAKLNRLARDLFPRSPPQNSVAIVVDGVVQAAPAFSEPSFLGGGIVISGNFTEAEAKALAVVANGEAAAVPGGVAD